MSSVNDISFIYICRFIFKCVKRFYVHTDGILSTYANSQRLFWVNEANVGKDNGTDSI